MVLYGQSKLYRTPQKFSPKDITDKVGGYAGTLGKVASEVVDELLLRNVDIDYVKQGNKRWFVLK